MIGPIDRREISSIIQLAHVEKERESEREREKKRAGRRSKKIVLEKEEDGDSEIEIEKRKRERKRVKTVIVKEAVITIMAKTGPNPGASHACKASERGYTLVVQASFRSLSGGHAN